jgi:dipeptidyl aminopeptidase/acylaminoacyl peptidase
VKKLIVLAVLLATAVPASATTARIIASQDAWPVYAPDGRHIAFTRIYQNHMQLLAFDTSSGVVTAIGSNAGQLEPSWSGDGTQIAYSSGGILWTVRADGYGKQRYAAPTRALAPAWRPGTSDLAYLTTHGARNTDLWVAGKLWARNAIGNPAWSPDGDTLAFQRDDGIYLTGSPNGEHRIAVVDEPGPPAWSHDGRRVAFVSRGSLYVTYNDGRAPKLVARNQANGVRPSWSPDDATVQVGGAFDPDADGYAAPAPRAACPGHSGLRQNGRMLTGSCLVDGTAGADVIEGTLLQGDLIRGFAGNDRIHANDGHTDAVNCGPGRDTVWADRSDKLTDCEVSHR